MMSKFPTLKKLNPTRPTGLPINTLESLLNTFPQAMMIVDRENLKVLCANIKASELTAYARSDLSDLHLDQFLFPPDNTPIVDLFSDQESDTQSDIICDLLHHAGHRVPTVLTVTRLDSGDKLYLVTFNTQEEVLQSSLAIRRQQNLWENLNQITLAYAQHDLQSALQKVIAQAADLSGATTVAIYLAEGQSPNLWQAAAQDPASILPENISAHDLEKLNHAMLWVNGKHPNTPLHQKARASNLAFMASAPIGEANAAIGLFIAAGSANPPKPILEIIQFLANQVYFHIQSNTLINQLRKDLEGLQLQQLAYDTVFDSIDDGLIFLTPERQILRLNTAAEIALGYTNLEVRELPIVNILICNENLETTFRFVEEELRPSSLSSLRLYRRNGDSYLANLRVLPITSNGDLHSNLLILQDQSEQEEYKTRNQMLEQRATLADITASFAHEVRNPINNISTGLQLLALNLPSDDSNQENILRLQNDCERLADLVKSGLSFVRPVEYKLEPVDLDKIITSLMDRWRNRLNRTQVKYNPQIEENLPPVDGDLRALEQVFTNLIDNAIQAMEPDGGVLTINVRHFGGIEERSYVEVNILDTGPGIPLDTREHIFEPFFTTKHSGTGLGLAIVKRIVTAHKGSIHVSSIPGGTMFRVRIPCV